MLLREKIEDINKKLLETYGTEINCGDKPKFRVVFSEDQFEKRWTNYSDEGFELLEPEVRNLPKYRQWVRDKYVLERLVPVVGETDLTEKYSYEPAWVFQDKDGKYLPPFFEGCQFIIESMLAAMGRANTHTKYKDKNVSKEERAAELERVMNDLFGNETDVGDALAYGSGVSLASTDSGSYEALKRKLVH